MPCAHASSTAVVITRVCQYRQLDRVYGGQSQTHPPSLLLLIVVVVAGVRISASISPVMRWQRRRRRRPSYVDRIDAGHPLGGANVLRDLRHLAVQYAKLAAVNLGVVHANTVVGLRTKAKNNWNKPKCDTRTSKQLTSMHHACAIRRSCSAEPSFCSSERVARDSTTDIA